MDMMKWVQMAEGTAIRWDNTTYGPGIGENPRSDLLVQVPVGFPDRFDISGGGAQRIVDAGLADVAASMGSTGADSAPAAPIDVPMPVLSPIPNPGTAAFTADDFLSALRNAGVSIPATGENGSVTLADVLGVLSDPRPTDAPGAALVETPAPETPVAAPIDPTEVSEVPSAPDTPSAPIVAPVAPTGEPMPDPTPEPVVDAAPDVAPESTPDVAPDAVPDATPDVVADAAPTGRRTRSA